MNAGRELDIIIAEKILGWTKIRSSVQGHTGLILFHGVRPGEVPSKYTGYQPEFSIPEYSADIKAAWELVNALDKKGFSFNLSLLVGWTASFYPKDRAQDNEASASTAPHAICLSALNAFGL